MDGLKEWVRGLVTLVLLATCLEVLIPATGMKKYVRMTMSFLVVLAMVRPVAAFLGRPAEVDLTPVVQVSGGSLPSLTQVMADARQFRERSRSLATREVKARLAEEARRAALSVSGVSGATAEVQLAAESGEPRITGVQVTLTQGAAPGAVEPVRPVGQPHAAPQGTAADDAVAKAVQQEVARRLGIDQGLVKVYRIKKEP